MVYLRGVQVVSGGHVFDGVVHRVVEIIVVDLVEVKAEVVYDVSAIHARGIIRFCSIIDSNNYDNICPFIVVFLTAEKKIKYCRMMQYPLRKIKVTTFAI